MSTTSSQQDHYCQKRIRNNNIKAKKPVSEFFPKTEVGIHYVYMYFLSYDVMVYGLMHTLIHVCALSDN
jgi:hypothetical protein